MDFYEAVNNRRSIRNFTDEKIPEETIKRIVEAAYKAPANDHFRDWHYIVITDKDKMREVIDGVPKNLNEKDVDNMTFISDPEQKRAYQIAVPMQYRMLIDAAAIIIPLMKKKCDILHPSSLSDLNCYASVWCSIENLWLAAVAEGYACNLRIPLGDEESIARKVLGFPENYMIPCFIGVGKATEDAVKTKQIDINIDELLHWEKF
ncbi:MAG: nitroreductase family protein [Clostridiales bacterium]|nr:nitroreductase family protein [Clostridiales bacterium]